MGIVNCPLVNTTAPAPARCPSKCTVRNQLTALVSMLIVDTGKSNRVLPHGKVHNVQFRRASLFRTEISTPDADCLLAKEAALVEDRRRSHQTRNVHANRVLARCVRNQFMTTPAGTSLVSFGAKQECPFGPPAPDRRLFLQPP